MENRLGAASQIGIEHVVSDVAPSSVASYITAGTVRRIATSGQARSALLPNVPTMTELGHPHLTVDLYCGMLGPADMPTPVAGRLRAGAKAVDVHIGG
jgi:tripartite-type tricarboxylate transporter receptor subunit TctC